MEKHQVDQSCEIYANGSKEECLVSFFVSKDFVDDEFGIIVKRGTKFKYVSQVVDRKEEPGAKILITVRAKREEDFSLYDDFFTVYPDEPINFYYIDCGRPFMVTIATNDGEKLKAEATGIHSF